ncbi:MAG: hypothetical protein QXS01_04785, partial [Candidatus Bathyarchaeia archaeon]
EVRFVAFRIPFDDLSPELFAVAFEEIFEAEERTQKPEYRVTPKTQRELYLEGVEEPEEGEQAQRTMEGVGDLSQLKYVGNKIGGKYLRAPDIFFTILEKGKRILVPLHQVAEVKAGIITGDNRSFYRPRISKQVPDGWLPVFKSPREVHTIELQEKDARTLLRVDNAPFRIKRAPLLWPDLRGDRHICHLNQDGLPFEHNFHGIVPKEGIQTEILCALLNTNLTAFFVEVLARTSLGGGAARLLRSDLINLPVVDPNCLTSSERERLLYAFNRLRRLPVGSLLEQIRISPEGNVLISPDRQAMDLVVFELLNLSPAEQYEMYKALIELVAMRLGKARSVRKKGAK